MIFYEVKNKNDNRRYEKCKDIFLRPPPPAPRKVQVEVSLKSGSKCSKFGAISKQSNFEHIPLKSVSKGNRGHCPKGDILARNIKRV